MEVREDFCGICAAVPIALAGLGATSYAASGEEYKKRRMIMVIGCAIAVIVSLYFLVRYWGCSKCKA